MSPRAAPNAPTPSVKATLIGATAPPIPSIKATLPGAAASVAPQPDRTKATAPLAPKAPVAAKPVRQPSSPDLGQAPMPPWRILPDANAPAAEAPVPQAMTPVAPPAATTPVAATFATTPAVVTPPQPPLGPAHVSPPPPPVGPAHVSPPPLPQEPARAYREPAVAPAEDPRPIIRAAIDEAMVPVHQALRDLVRRVEELEKRPAVAATLTAAPVVREAYRQAMPSYPPPVTTHAAVRAQAPVLDVAAINRDVHIEVDGALDGSKRRRRLALTFVLLLLVVFGGLFGALAHSYTPHGSSLETAATLNALV